MRERYPVRKSVSSLVLMAALVCVISGQVSVRCWAVSSKITRHSSGKELSQGQVSGVVISSRGTIQLGRSAETIADEFEDVWSVDSVVAIGGTVYIGTSPNGDVYKYSLGKLTKIYSTAERAADAEQEEADEESAEKKHLSNEHIFAMAGDVAGRLLVAVSGDNCRLMRLIGEEFETVFEPEEEKYIFAIAVAADGAIYLGTGPEGRVYRLDSLGGEAEVIYKSRDKNILSLVAGSDGFVYAGSDGRGIIYKLNPKAKTATILYDSDQSEITALLESGDGGLYAASTSADIVDMQAKFAAKTIPAGRPDSKSQEGGNSDKQESGLKLKIANTQNDKNGKNSSSKRSSRKEAPPEQLSFVYKVTRDGFVSEVFSEPAILFGLIGQDEEILVGTGNKGQLFAIEPSDEQEVIIYEDEKAWQITSMGVSGEDLYIGTANPAKLIRLGKRYSDEGTYTSDLVDAGQPANWGKLQIDADVPGGCEVLVSSRSGNVKDINDPSFSEWTESAAVTEPVQLLCPVARFCQYRLTLKSKNGLKSPVVREVAVANTVPNLAPKVEEVTITHITEGAKAGFFKIAYKAKDRNEDKLIYKMDFKRTEWANWIEIEDQFEKDSFEWDTRTVEDGRYEIKVTASDERDNSSATKLAGSRISEVFVVDNTPPSIKRSVVRVGRDKVTIALTVGDKLSAIGSCDYTVNSSEQWRGTVPDDLVYDTTEEDFTIIIEELDAGEHIVSVKVSDDVGNTMYKSFMVTVAGG